MTKAEFKKLHEFSDDNMDFIDHVIKLTGGKIVGIKETKCLQMPTIRGII